MPDLHDRIKQVRERRNRKNRARYQLARSLGFTGPEAEIMSHWSEARITQYAKEKER